MAPARLNRLPTPSRVPEEAGAPGRIEGYGKPFLGNINHCVSYAHSLAFPLAFYSVISLERRIIAQSDAAKFASCRLYTFGRGSKPSTDAVSGAPERHHDKLSATPPSPSAGSGRRIHLRRRQGFAGRPRLELVEYRVQSADTRRQRVTVFADRPFQLRREGDLLVFGEFKVRDSRYSDAGRR